MQLLPSPQLRPYIKHYLFIENSDALHKQLRIFSDGNTGIVFCLHTLLTDSNSQQLPEVFAYGQITNYRTLYTHGPVSLLIVVFKPYGMHALLNIPGAILKGDLVDLQSVIGTGAKDIYESLLEAGDKYRMSACLDGFFNGLLSSPATALHPMVSATAEWILQRKGLFRAEELVAFTGWQQRSIERAFNEVVGLSPKKLGGIVRLHHFLGTIRTSTTQLKYTPLAYEAGYYDQAHLIREFRKITGLTPSAYTIKEYHLAVNVVGIPDENVQFQAIPIK
jgi:AraC-like DNA-binding protein